MSEDANHSQNLPAVQQRKAIVADAIPVFDTDRFEHYGRIAAVMARSSIVPATLREGDAVANCFQVVELADRWGYSPFAVAQCASIVHGKLMLEGKLVAAVLQSKLGMKLNHYFIGDWGKDDYRIFVTDAELSETQVEELRPHMKIHGVRMIDGSVGEWKTKEKGGAVKGNWLNQPDVQLVYRGDRTFARVYESAVMLGVITDDEMDDFSDRRLQVESQPALTDGPARKPRTPRAAPAAMDVAAEGAKAAPDAPQPADEAKPPEVEEGETHDAEFEEVQPQDEAGPIVEGEQVTDKPEAELCGAEAGAIADAIEGVLDADLAGGTRAPAGELYCLSSDQPDDAGRVPTYKDGVGFSRVKVDSKSKPAAYDLHPLEDDDADAEGLAGVSQAQDNLDAANAAAPNPMTEALDRIDTAESYLAGKQVVKTLAATDYWRNSDKGAQGHVRKKLWDTYVQLRDEGRETTSPVEDFMLMRLFIEFGAETKADIDGMWPRFWKNGAYKQANEADQRAITELMLARKEVLAA